MTSYKRNEFSWSEYNSALTPLSARMLEHNEASNFNFIESGLYPHVRDILALVILFGANTRTNPTFRVLDYGSNLVVWSNLKNKLDLEYLELMIYDPYSDPEGPTCQIPGIGSIQVAQSLEESLLQEFELIVFGSSAQYQRQFLTETLLSALDKNPDMVLFTHTPLSINTNLVSRQTNATKLSQYLHPLSELMDKMEKSGYRLQFKSALDSNLAAVEEDMRMEVQLLNLLFVKAEQ